MGRNNAMPMLMMLIVIAGAAVAFTKRCEWFKMCGDLPDLSLPKLFSRPDLYDPKANVGPGAIPVKAVAPAVGDIPTKQVAMGPGDPRSWGWSSGSKFARISYT